MGKYIIYWVLVVIYQKPCDNSVKSEYINDNCIISDTIYVKKQIEIDSLDNAIRFESRLKYAKHRAEYIDKQILSEIEVCPKVLIDTIYTNDFAEIYQKTKK